MEYTSHDENTDLKDPTTSDDGEDSEMRPATPHTSTGCSTAESRTDSEKTEQALDNPPPGERDVSKKDCGEEAPSPYMEQHQESEMEPSTSSRAEANMGQAEIELSRADGSMPKAVEIFPPEDSSVDHTKPDCISVVDMEQSSLAGKEISDSIFKLTSASAADTDADTDPQDGADPSASSSAQAATDSAEVITKSGTADLMSAENSSSWSCQQATSVVTIATKESKGPDTISGNNLAATVEGESGEVTDMDITAGAETKTQPPTVSTSVVIRQESEKTAQASTEAEKNLEVETDGAPEPKGPLPGETSNKLSTAVGKVTGDQVMGVYRRRVSSLNSSDDESSSSDSQVLLVANSSDDEDFTTKHETGDGLPRKVGSGAIRTKGELQVEDLPPLEDMHIEVDDSVILHEIGSISAVVGILVVVKAKPDVPALNADSILFTNDRKVLGQVFEIFGPVSSPLYSIRFNTIQQIEDRGVKTGLPVFFAPRVEEYTHYVFLEQLRQLKGSDASWEHNNEPPQQYIEYSDDEEERRAKARSRGKEPTPGGDTDQTQHRKKTRTQRRNRRPHDSEGSTDGKDGRTQPSIQSWPPDVPGHRNPAGSGDHQHKPAYRAPRGNPFGQPAANRQGSHPHSQHRYRQPPPAGNRVQGHGGQPGYYSGAPPGAPPPPASSLQYQPPMMGGPTPGLWGMPNTNIPPPSGFPPYGAVSGPPPPSASPPPNHMVAPPGVPGTSAQSRPLVDVRYVQSQGMNSRQNSAQPQRPYIQQQRHPQFGSVPGHPQFGNPPGHPQFGSAPSFQSGPQYGWMPPPPPR